MRRRSRKPTSNQVENMYSISTSSACSRRSAFRCGNMSARRSTRKRMPPSNTLKRCNRRRRGDTVARRYCTSAAASSGVPTAAANCACACFTFCASATNCSLISSHMSRRCASVALAYQSATPWARRPPSTSLTRASTMAFNSSRVRRSTRGDRASSWRRSVADRRSRVERTPRVAPAEAEPPFSIACDDPSTLGMAGFDPGFGSGSSLDMLRPIQVDVFMRGLPSP
ncbi:MAG: hypothetical protein BWX79_02898 [Alphaproteobacteria bacterium ADurb.Bin100]|nr:MAG: hypothetical protein BWX79_02898 [Alphaproteobacteria bacterium ADurb.Bin100]